MKSTVKRRSQGLEPAIYNCLIKGKPCSFDAVMKDRISIKMAVKEDHGHLFSASSYEAWLKGFISGAISKEDFYSFLNSNARVFLNIPYQGREKITPAFFAQQDLFSLLASNNPMPSTEVGVRKVQSAAMKSLEDIIRQEANQNLPFSYRQFSYGEKKQIIDCLYGLDDLTDEEKEGVRNILPSLAEGKDSVSIILYGMCLFGEGVDEWSGFKKDNGLALTQFKKAYETGDYYGRFLMGAVYYTNALKDPSGSDYQEAFKCFEFAAEHEELDAFPCLADMYMSGHYVPLNLKEARFLLETNLKEALDFMKKRKSIYYLAPYSFFLAKLMIIEKSQDSSVILFLLVLADYIYNARIDNGTSYIDMYFQSKVKNYLSAYQKKIGFKSVPFCLPYELSYEEEEAFFNSYISYFDNASEIRIHGRKGDNHIYFDVFQPNGDNFPLVLINSLSVSMVSALRLEGETNVGLIEDIDKKMTMDEFSKVSYFPHFGMQINNGSYKIMRIFLTGLAMFDKKIYSIGDRVTIKKAYGVYKKGQKGIIKDIRPDKAKILVEFSDPARGTWGVMEVSNNDVKKDM